jgi:hypothetical protein
MAKAKNMIDANELITILRESRKAMNKQFRRTDVYANGLKAGIDDAIRHASGLRDGLTYDATADTWQAPKSAA